MQKKISATANSHLYSISIGTINSNKFLVESFDTNIFGINKDYVINIFLFSEIKLNAKLLASKINLYSHDGKIISSGMLSKLTSLQSGINNYYYYKVSVTSPLFVLKLSSTPRSFINKDIKQILSEVLTKQHQLKISFDLDVSKLIKFKLYVQYNETDFEFFERILISAKLNYCFQFKNNSHSGNIFLRISNNKANHQLEVNHKKLKCIEDKSMGHNCPIISAWQAKYNNNSSYILAETNVVNLIPSQVLEIYDIGASHINGQYIIETIQITGNQKTVMANNIDTDNSLSSSFTSTIKLIPITYKFISQLDISCDKLSYPNKYEYNHQTKYLTARVVSYEGLEIPDIDQNGDYIIKFPFDTNNEVTSTHRVKLLQPFSKQTPSMHFPLHPGTQVVVAFLNGNYNNPVIIGTLPCPKFSSLITNKNSSLSKIATLNSNAIEIEDKPNSKKISISNHDNLFELDATKGNNTIVIKSNNGGIKTHSGTNTNIISHKSLYNYCKNLQVKINNNLFIHVEKENLHKQTKNLIELSADAKIRFKTNNSWRIDAEKDIKFLAKQHISAFTEKDITIHNTKDNIILAANSYLSITTSNRQSIKLKSGTSYIEACNQGCLKISSPVIKITAPNILQEINNFHYV